MKNNRLRQLIQVLLPRHDQFFSLFEEDAKNLGEAARAFLDLVKLRRNHKRAEKIKAIENLEHQGDDITHRIFHELSSSFITPFDREDIHSLTSALDDILDYIQGSAKRIQLYEIKTLPLQTIALVETLNKAIEELADAIPKLRDMENKQEVLDACVRINSYENQADDIFEHTIADLFKKKSTNTLDVIKIKEFLVGVETATDKCEDAANVLESIILKST